MTVESITVVLHHSRSSGTTLNVAIGIANHDGDGGAWPAIETLMKYARKSERTVQRALEELQALGEIVVHYNAGGDRNTPADRRPNLYELVLSCPPECDRTKNHRMPGDKGYGVTPTSPRRKKRGDTSVTPRGDRSDAPRGAIRDVDGVPPVAPEPPLETNTPQPPAQRGACSRHPNTRGDNCRGCGTTQRQLDAAARTRAAAEKRAADLAAIEADRARRQAAADVNSPGVASEVDAARTRIRSSRKAS